MLLVHIIYFTYNATLVKSVYTSSVLLNLATIHYKTQDGYYLGERPIVVDPTYI